MSELMQIFSGNPMTTLVGRKIEQATDPSLQTDDWALNLEICDIINETEDGARDAVRAIRRRLQTEASRNFTITHRTLTVLETCVNNCHRKFHSLALTKDFVGDLVKVIGPKNNPPSDLQDRVLSLIERWASAFENQPDLNGVVQVYQELKSKGITFPPQNLDTLAPIQTPRRTVPGSMSPPAQSNPGIDTNNMQQHQQPIASYQEDIGATRATLTATGYDKIMSDLNVVQSSVNVFNEMLGQIDSRPNEEDWNLLKDLDVTCKQMKIRIVELIEQVTNEDVTSELLRLNDELNNVFVKYERALKRRSTQSTSSPQQAITTADQPSSKPKEMSLIDFNADENIAGSITTRPAIPTSSETKVVSEPVAAANDPDFDIFAKSRSSVYSDRSRPTNYDPVDEASTSLGKLALQKSNTQIPDEISSVREQDFEEVEKWLAIDQGASSSTPVSIPNSEFENFLASRALAGSANRDSGDSAKTKDSSQNTKSAESS